MNAFYNEIANGVLQIVCAVIGILLTAIVVPWLKQNAIPWLKEKQLYGIVSKFVHAAEKLAETGVIDRESKRDYVVSLLKNKGYDITPETEAFIESAVKELDMAAKLGIDEILGVFEDGEDRLDPSASEKE